MQLTVAEVIALPLIQAGDPEVLSAHRFTETIRWVHVSDVPDLSALVQGGELVLTTGAALRDSPRRYLSGMAEAGVLGVVVEIGDADLDPGMGVIAAEFDLALVALHRQVRFVEVTEAVHRLIVADQYERVDFDRRVHETFTELSLKRPSAVSLRGRPADLLRDWERRSRLRATAEGWAVTAVGPRAEQWGRLIVPQPSPDPDRTRMVLERAAVALALQRMIERDRTGLHHQAQSGLIDDVARGRIADEREVAARAHALGLRSAARYLPVVVRVNRTPTSDPVAGQRRNVLMVDTVLHTVNASGHTGLCALRRDGEVGAVLALGVTRPPEEALAALGTALRTEIARVDGTAGAVLAVGPAADGVIDAVTGLGEAAHIAEVALAMRGARSAEDNGVPFYRAADVRLHGLISLLRDDPRVQTFAETELRALLAGDPAHLDLLREYLKLAGNKAAVAARLHISRPALYKRLAAVRSALGVDLDDGESMTSLHVALMVLDAQGRAVLS
ncbi:PucR family transcriptional regulator ligand-binding domain-containing protein [Mycolicibacterium frederiksbergense]|uniref:PucR family transcriptional regulator n=1 Tax=Mycolicibacterium frederiksbergense TaxID=117567 RepID=UPI0039EFBC88